MGARSHSVQLVAEDCRGCTNCIKLCPTQAIRVRAGKAQINLDRCIDCGECIRACENHAKVAVTDPLAAIRSFDYAVALPAPALYGQFGLDVEPEEIHGALLALGFSEVWEVALGADQLTEPIRQAIAATGTRPLISAACPAIVRLLQVRFPALIENLVPVVSPLWTVATAARGQLERDRALAGKRIGLFFLTPCPAKVMEVREPSWAEQSPVDGAISIVELYGPIKKLLGQGLSSPLSSTGVGIGWARSGGENQALGLRRQLAVDGIHSVLEVLDEIELGKLSDVDYVEALACRGGCVGGSLNVANPFLARVKIRELATNRGEQTRSQLEISDFSFPNRPEPRPGFGLDADLVRAMDKLEHLEQALDKLPGLDCGSCGAPTCRALAEDIVQGQVGELDCVFRLREEVQVMAEELLQMAKRLPHAIKPRDNP